MSIQRVDRMLTRHNVSGLGRLLRHRDVLVRRRAAQALGQLADPRAIPYLAQALRRSADDYVLQWSIDALVAIGDPQAIDVLTEAMFSTAYRRAGLAAQGLAALDHPQAQIALHLRDVLLRNDWESLAATGENALRTLAVILRSEQYAAWPTGKRKHFLEIATLLGVTMAGRDRELLNMGVFMSGVHSVGDLIRGLRHRSPEVRIAAAEKLALSGITWTTGPLFRRFRWELRDGKGERRVAVAIAQALSRLDDRRAIDYFKHTLYKAGGGQAAAAARSLAEIGTPDAIETLFWFAASPPPPPAYRNVPMALSALATVGPATVEVLRPHFTHDEVSVRRLALEVITRTGHPDLAQILSEFARDSDHDLQHAALDAIADLDSACAAETLFGLAQEMPKRWVTRALASITDPAGPRYLRQLVPDLTDLAGVLVDEDRQPLTHAAVQILKEHNFGGSQGWDWQAVSARARTDGEGRFFLSLLSTDQDSRFRIKVTAPGTDHRALGDRFVADFIPVFGETNDVQMRIDRYFKRLMVTNRTYEQRY